MAMRILPAWFRSHFWTRGILTLLMLVVCLHFYFEWRSARRWQDYCREARARGVKLTLREFAPPAILAEENFANLPMLQAVFVANGPKPFAFPAAGGNVPPLASAIKGGPVNWVGWQQFFLKAGFIPETSADPVGDVLHALEHYEPQFQEWSQWQSRPHSRFALDLKVGASMPLPHLGTFGDAARLFHLRAQAHLALGDSAAACADFRNGLQAYRALAEEPTLICGLVRIAALAQIDAAVGNGLQHHAWGEAELRQIDQDLAAVQIWQDYLLAMTTERGFSNSSVEDTFERKPLDRGRRISEIIAGSGVPGVTSAKLPPWVGALIPKRVFRDNELRLNRFFDEALARVSPAGTHFDLDREIRSTPDHLTSDFERYYYFLSDLSIPVFQTMEKHYIAAQILIDETRLAIALERYRLRKGEYPETLAGLAPEFLPEVPLDAYSGKIYLYRRTDGGSFLLYSVGQNRQDDHGVFDPTKSERFQLDAIWPYAPPAANP
jgi:hypothetical protein